MKINSSSSSPSCHPSRAWNLLPFTTKTRRGREVSTSSSSSSSSSSALSMGILDSMGDLMSGTSNAARKNELESYLSKLQRRVDRINALESDIEDLSDEELVQKTNEFKQRLMAENGEDINGIILEEAFAVVREASWRVLEQRHYDVQLIGGMILHDGRLAEMKTGEGKTLVSTLPCYLNALSSGQKPSFVITVNDYLARRDMETMGQVYKFLGLTVGLIQSTMTEQERKAAYACDVVYVTNSELGFDYLRDHLALSPEQTVLPGGASQFSGFCVVDEADSVLIDEARTPLILSKQVDAPANKYKVAQTLANALREGVHYTVDQKNKNVILTDRGYRDCENALGIQSLFEDPGDGSGAWASFVLNAAKAKELFSLDKEYALLMDGEKKVGVGIIDAFTGRVMDGRRWSDGLHQSIEAKEGIDVSSQSKVIAKVTYQSLFRQFPRLSGMTGTAMSDALEFETTYGLMVTPVPTALPVARRDYADVCFKTRKAANDALVNEVIGVAGGGDDGTKGKGRPCLIGTTSVAQSEQIVQALANRGVKAELLNASPKNAARESEIIAQAGRMGVVTVATNMAGRGTDILLGGCPSTMARLMTRSALLGEDVLSPDEMATLLPLVPPDDYYPCPLSDDVILALKEAASAIKKHFGSDFTAIQLDELLTIATDTTESEEDPDYTIKLRNAADAVKETYKAVLSEEKEAVLKAGGLYVMGTNRHESRRIDYQLRGRAGRQGDPGSSRFFLSFEDDMFVIFGGEGLKKSLDMFRVSDDMPVEAPQITDSLNKVQDTVEEKFREIRSEILNFDEVLNSQRSVIYSRRRNILFSSLEETMDLMSQYNKETVVDIVKAQTNKDGVVDVDKVLEKVGQFFPPVQPVVDSGDLKGLDCDGVIAFLNVAVDEVFKTIIEKKETDESSSTVAKTAKYLTLVSMDNAWSDHLQNMENLKESVVLRKYQGLDPLAEYKNEGYKYFQGLEDRMRFNSIYSVWQNIMT